MKGVEELEHLEETRAWQGLGQHVGEHVGAGEVLDDHVELTDGVAEELGGAEDVFCLFEGHRVVGHIDGRLGVTKEQRGGVEFEDAQVMQDGAEEENLFCGKGSAEVLGLRARQGDGALGFAKPMEDATADDEEKAPLQEKFVVQLESTRLMKERREVEGR